MIWRIVGNSGGRILRLPSLALSDSNFTTKNSSRVQCIATNLRGFSIEAFDRNEQMSTMQKELEPPRNAYVKIDIINRISDLVFVHIRDKNVSIDTTVELFKKGKVHEYILLVLRRCYHSHALELRSRLSYAGITHLEFSQAIAKVKFTLESEPDSNIVFEEKRYGCDEIIKIFNHMNLNDVEYECVRILLSLREDRYVDPHLWAI